MVEHPLFLLIVGTSDKLYEWEQGSCKQLQEAAGAGFAPVQWRTAVHIARVSPPITPAP